MNRPFSSDDFIRSYEIIKTYSRIYIFLFRCLTRQMATFWNIKEFPITLNPQSSKILVAVLYVCVVQLKWNKKLTNPVAPHTILYQVIFWSVNVILSVSYCDANTSRVHISGRTGRYPKPSIGYLHKYHGEMGFKTSDSGYPFRHYEYMIAISCCSVFLYRLIHRFYFSCSE